MKTTLALLVLFGLSFGHIAFAENINTGVSGAPSIAGVECAGTALRVRESAITLAHAEFVQMSSLAYTLRSMQLALVYASTTPGSALKRYSDSVWDLFSTIMEGATGNWHNATSKAWNAYKSALENCTIALDSTDLGNETDEQE